MLWEVDRPLWLHRPLLPFPKKKAHLIAELFSLRRRFYLLHRRRRASKLFLPRPRCLVARFQLLSSIKTWHYRNEIVENSRFQRKELGHYFFLYDFRCGKIFFFLSFINLICPRLTIPIVLGRLDDWLDVFVVRLTIFSGW